MNIIAIGAHLDDIEISDLDDDPSRTREEALREGRATVAILGLESLETLDFPMKDISYSSRSVEAIERQLRPFAPDLALTHWPHDTHQDHRAAALATISTAGRLEKILMYEPMAPLGRSSRVFTDARAVHLPHVCHRPHC